MDDSHAKLVAAATGSTLTALSMTPFDVVKTRLQTQPPARESVFQKSTVPQACCRPSSLGCVRNMSSYAGSLPQEVVCIWDHGVMRKERVRGFWDAVRHVVKAEGLRGLWKGVGTSLIIGVPSSTCYMLTYDYFVHVLLPPVSPSPALTPLFSGVLARTLISSLASPLELVRTNLQSTPSSPETPHTLRSVLTSVRAATALHGAGALWRGVSATLWRDVPFSGIYWATYEQLKQRFAAQGHGGPSTAFACGAMAGTLSAVIVSPFDTLKTRRQAYVMASLSTAAAAGGEGSVEGPRRSLVGVLREIVRNEGVAALYAGLTPRIAKVAPACGIMISCYEGIGKMLEEKRTDKEMNSVD